MRVRLSASDRCAICARVQVRAEDRDMPLALE
jgi:hypothetical protein